MPNIKPFEKYPEKYENWFEKNKFVYHSEVNAIKDLMPDFKKGIEIGVGSGRFAIPLDIGLGLEPSAKMRRLAHKKGIKTINAVGEDIPLKSSSFDLVLMVTTLCFLDDAEKAFGEVHRILENNGYFINGFVDKNSAIGKIYQKNKNKSLFYGPAKFYSVAEVTELLEKTGFNDFEYRQTIFRPLGDITSLEEIKVGHGKGSFIVIRAKKC